MCQGLARSCRAAPPPQLSWSCSGWHPTRRGPLVQLQAQGPLGHRSVLTASLSLQ